MNDLILIFVVLLNEDIILERNKDK